MNHDSEIEREWRILRKKVTAFGNIAETRGNEKEAAGGNGLHQPAIRLLTKKLD